MRALRTEQANDRDIDDIVSRVFVISSSILFLSFFSVRSLAFIVSTVRSSDLWREIAPH